MIKLLTAENKNDFQEKRNSVIFNNIYFELTEEFWEIYKKE
jgi:hypothetical protein